MPSKNIVKVYVKDGFYHIYNRGVEKRTIFEDEQDYKVFLKYLKEYLSALQDSQMFKKNFISKGGTFKGIPRQPKNYQKEIDLVAFCLMPNHFHLLIKQHTQNAIEKFMRSLATRYSLYFNKKYSRVGKLFQGHYKASLITDDSYLLHLSRYIHLNPIEYTNDLKNAYSSYVNYLGLRKASWVKPNTILSFFNKNILPELKKINTYKDFVEKYKKDSAKFLGELTLE